jgi:hypothetical protein
MPGTNSNLLRAMDVAAIHVDHAVAVEEESAAGHLFSRFHRFS